MIGRLFHWIAGGCYNLAGQAEYESELGDRYSDGYSPHIPISQWRLGTLQLTALIGSAVGNILEFTGVVLGSRKKPSLLDSL